MSEQQEKQASDLIERIDLEIAWLIRTKQFLPKTLQDCKSRIEELESALLAYHKYPAIKAYVGSAVYDKAETALEVK